MLVTELKPKSSILPLLGEKTFIVCCEGCRELDFSGTGPAELINDLRSAAEVAGVVSAGHICGPGRLAERLARYKAEVDSADTLLIISCGVGAQAAADEFEGKKVLTACDTYPLPGLAGLTPPEFDCARCGQCLLNETGGFCPVSACPKGLRNGQCGGAKKGKCEVDREKDCAWEGLT